jgi:hypothetical protein
MTAVGADIVEAAFLRGIYLATPEDWERFLKAKEEATEAEYGPVDVDVLRADLARLKRQRDGYLDQEASGLIERADLVEKLGAVDARRDAIEAAIEAAESARATLADITEAVDDLKATVFGGSPLWDKSVVGQVTFVAGGAHKEGTDAALLSAVLKTLDTPTDRYGRSPILPGWVVEAASVWVTVLDAEVFVTANEDDPRRPFLRVELSGQALNSVGVSASRTSYRGRSGTANLRPSVDRQRNGG